MQVCKYASMQVCTYAHICKYASMHNLTEATKQKGICTYDDNVDHLIWNHLVTKGSFRNSSFNKNGSDVSSRARFFKFDFKLNPFKHK